MITILGGEMLCALGSKPQRLEALRAGRSRPGSVKVNVGGSELEYPYHRIDNSPRISDHKIVASYLQQVIGDLLLNHPAVTASDPSRIGLFLGSSSIDYSLAWPIEEAVDDSFAARCQRQRVGGGNYLEDLQRYSGFSGPVLTYNTACTSSANALLGAASLLASKIIDYAIVFGLELYSPTTLEGFSLLQLLADSAARPFAQDRNGIVLGETVSACLLSHDDVAPAKWWLRGGKSGCDTTSVTGADVSGSGFAKVMHGALQECGLKPEGISLVKAHGTASDLNDRAEMQAMNRVFPTIPPYLSLKPYIGHTLGGCGVAELLRMFESVDAGFVPESLSFSPLDCEFAQPPISENRALVSGIFMLNYFGFGGNNTSLIIEKVRA